ncbi:MAG TPA: DUF3467 domain-containing protein [candidate division Zixibacteria bacterium]|nr:DUF3467 domain-containing protein [candidate division Zixibacteria bacterium]
MAKKGSKKETKKAGPIIQATTDFKTVYAIGAIGSFNQYDLRIFFYDKILPDKKDKVYASPLELVLSPRTAKELTNWLNRQIEAYEKTFGEIKFIDEKNLTKYLDETAKIKKREETKLKKESSGSKPS